MGDEDIKTSVPIEEIRAVFNHWVDTVIVPTRNPKRKPVLDERRKRKISKAIELYGEETCKDAVSGVLHSDWHMGRNPRGKQYLDIELILRDAKHIEMFLDYFDKAEFGDGGFDLSVSTGPF